MLTPVQPWRQIVFRSREEAVLEDVEADRSPLKPTQIAGRTLATLTSPGTELNGAYLGDRFPARPGYAAIFEVEQRGEEVEGVELGERYFCMGRHCSHQRVQQGEALKVPQSLATLDALFARLAGISVTTLSTTYARPPDSVVVFGLGPVGLLAAQIFSACGYRVSCVEPIAHRRDIAERLGLPSMYESAPLEDPSVANQAALVLECSGHEQAVLDACKLVRKRGEVVMIGVPWKRRTDLPSFDLTHAIFHRYVVLRSGWEWELPRTPAHFQTHCIFENFSFALELLAQKKISVDGWYGVRRPEDAQEVYQDLLHRRGEHLAHVFDWR